MAKQTQVEALDKALEVVTDIETRNTLQHMKEMIIKKNKAERGPTTNQVANKEIARYLLGHLDDKAYTITEMIKIYFTNTEWADLSVSRLSAIATQLLEENKLTREVVKRKAYYKKA